MSILPSSIPPPSQSVGQHRPAGDDKRDRDQRLSHTAGSFQRVTPASIPVPADKAAMANIGLLTCSSYGIAARVAINRVLTTLHEPKLKPLGAKPTES